MREINQIAKNYLILIGGAEDRKDDKIVLRRMIETTGAKNIVLIPNASSYPREVADSYFYAFRELGVESYEYFDIRHPDEADRDHHFEILEKADLVFFSGGDQEKLVKAIDGTQLLEKIKTRFFNGTLSIAGTSAGAAAVSDPMIYDGDYEGLKKGSVKFSPGFGFLDRVTVDTHFTARCRIQRLSQFLLTGESQHGIGVDEDTAAIISSDLKFEVVGSGVVTVISSDKITFSNFFNIGQNNLISVNNLRIGYLAAGTRFSIKRWMVIQPTDTKKKIFNFIEEAFKRN